MIVRNYKPKLMELPTISRQNTIIHRRLKKSKHKYHYQNIMGKNELWHQIININNVNNNLY